MISFYFAGLFSGWSATIARDAPYSGLYFMFYSKQKEVLTSARGGESLGVGDNFLCGMSAGVLACLITQPADVVKTQVKCRSVFMNQVINLMGLKNYNIFHSGEYNQ